MKASFPSFQWYKYFNCFICKLFISTDCNNIFSSNHQLKVSIIPLSLYFFSHISGVEFATSDFRKYKSNLSPSISDKRNSSKNFKSVLRKEKKFNIIQILFHFSAKRRISPSGKVFFSWPISYFFGLISKEFIRRIYIHIFYLRNAYGNENIDPGYIFNVSYILIM